ncbi:glycosyl-transferase for dystroglycan-domain-containing protein [Lobosporangium transversale]|uniref:Glycosyl-transferase for dystroglycan-domain-containing protein n=1 Tax=Lobosporangium transversale TaxID=64571 RepID=A0A1Y2GC35_9FUNG|nr:glycosyl-transferase for dystroglycan-domain-containing protein [Lobosporangium transversale]ORZ05706.1 glycosyl-transferase for dystroglycan-domain-containing protein [Lobosporangium transversale]|eukprot:XP_021877193.1 glycosyl-transferase for dystroglycan-domain-containing protein [Lobosporangium transversale]
MFKRTPGSRKEKNNDDDESTSPTITVSVPHDALEPPSPSRISEDSTYSGNHRSSSDRPKVQPHQPWKPWDPRKLTKTASNRPHLHGAPDAAVPGVLSPPSTVVSPSDTSKKAQSMMLKLPGIFSSGNPNTSGKTHLHGSSSKNQQQQPIEARLWNADLTVTSPLSPAGPRYISAIAGRGASRKIGNDSTGRFTSTWRGGGGHSSPTDHGSPTSLSGSRSSPTFSIANDNDSRPRFKSIVSSRPQPGNQREFTPLNIPASNQGNNDVDYSLDEEWEHVKAVSPEGTNTGSLEVTFFNSKSSDHGAHQHHHRRDEGLLYQDRHPHMRQHTGRNQYPVFLSNPRRALRARLFCLRRSRRLHPVVRLIVFLFLAGSVCFTTFHIIFKASRSNNRLRNSFDYTEQQLRVRRILGQSSTKKKTLSVFDVEAQNYSKHQWALNTYDINGSKAIVHVGEDYMLSKAFSGAIHPTQVIPFYFKASFRDEEDDDDLPMDDDGLQGSQPIARGDHTNDDTPVHVDPSLVTITTLITPDRYGVFLKLVKQYRGPISVATHIRKGPDQDARFHELNQFFKEHSILRKYVDLHVIVDQVDLQLNMWRNVARMFARTNYFMMLDVDFHIPSGLKNHMHHDPRIQELLSSGAALVIPAFEYDIKHDPKDSKYFPDTKAELLPLLEKKHIRVFHDSFPPGHAATDTPRWIKMSKRAIENAERPVGWQIGEVEEDTIEDTIKDTGRITEHEREEYLEQEAGGERPYKVTAFEPKYEPYIILKREGTPWCDERFVGYGANKAACLFEIYISGIDFWVMPQDFLIHQYHDYPTTNRKNGRILNKQLFVHFQQEICFKTLQRMIVTGEWYTSKADNLRHQCSEFDNFLASADQLAKEYEERNSNSLMEEPIYVSEADSEQRRYRANTDWKLKSPASQADDNSDSNSGEKYRSNIVGNDGRNNSHSGDGHTNVDKHIVNDGYQDRFMYRPKGRIWGGIQPKTFYIPPPDTEEDIPIDGIGIDEALAVDVDETKFNESDEGQEASVRDEEGTNLTGERLEQFRQGIIFPYGHDIDPFGPPKSDKDKIKDKDGLEDKAKHDKVNTVPNGANDQNSRDQYVEEDLGDQDQEHDNPSPKGWPSIKDGERYTSFEEAAGQLEARYQSLGVGSV